MAILDYLPKLKSGLGKIKKRPHTGLPSTNHSQKTRLKLV